MLYEILCDYFVIRSVHTHKRYDNVNLLSLLHCITLMSSWTVNFLQSDLTKPYHPIVYHPLLHNSIPCTSLFYSFSIESNHTISLFTLRIPDSYEAKIAMICNFWTFGPVIQLINHLFKIRPKAFFVRFWIEGLLAELQARMSRDCRFLLFWHHNYQVSLNIHCL